MSNEIKAIIGQPLQIIGLITPDSVSPAQLKAVADELASHKTETATQLNAIGDASQLNLIENSMNGHYKYIPINYTTGKLPVVENVSANKLPFRYLGIPNWTKITNANGQPTANYITTFWGSSTNDQLVLDPSHVGKKIQLACYVFADLGITFNLVLVFRTSTGSFIAEGGKVSVTTDGINAQRLEINAVIPANAGKISMQLQCDQYATLTSYYLGCPQLIIGENVARIASNPADKGKDYTAKLFKKTVVTLGDSIMRGEGNNGIGIGDILAAKYGMICEDVSVSGATLSKGVLADRGSIIDQYNNMTIVNPDFIVLDGGVNDVFFRDQISLGDIIEFTGVDNASVGYGAFNELTTIGALERLIMNLNLNHPLSTIIFVIPHKISNIYYKRADKPFSMVELREKILKVCEKWGVEVADIFGTTRLNTSLQLKSYYTTYCPDAVHPNQAGYEKFYIPKIVEKMVNSIL